MDIPRASDSSEPSPKTSDSSSADPVIKTHLRFPRQMRVTRSQDFEEALHGGIRLRDELLTAWVRLNHTKMTRLGLIVSRKHGKAVYRNRLKRLIREGFRLTQRDLLPGVDLICSPVPKAKLTLEGVQASFLRLNKRLRRRLPQVAIDIPPSSQNNH